ncbi:MAG: hypothetical protein COA82_06055 [Alkaliphilus sp.]|jgi:hypothetical protein|nr:hypothetical protein [bacterium AH-315-K05]MBN4069897.1 hypothetical protein [bacterium AH-315-G05]MBN4074448.1 hypothetical protein [bacterium AH-315-E09]PHS34951.1 MAG: hypothetical protein COA82_06055 [Alkaliphilus sp.]
MKFISCLTKELEKSIYKYPSIIKLWKKYYYDKIIEKEIELGEISREDHVLCIGGGAIPFTALDIALKTGASVAIIELDLVAVEKSRQLINRINMSNKIEVIHSSGQEFDASRYSVVHIASQVCPVDEILHNVWARIACGSKILFRCDKKKYKSFCNKAKVQNYSNQLKQVKQDGILMKATLLLVKEDGVKIDEANSRNFSSFATDTTSFVAS